MKRSKLFRKARLQFGFALALAACLLSSAFVAVQNGGVPLAIGIALLSALLIVFPARVLRAAGQGELKFELEQSISTAAPSIVFEAPPGPSRLWLHLNGERPGPWKVEISVQGERLAAKPASRRFAHSAFAKRARRTFIFDIHTTSEKPAPARIQFDISARPDKTSPTLAAFVTLQAPDGERS